MLVPEATGCDGNSFKENRSTHELVRSAAALGWNDAALFPSSSAMATAARGRFLMEGGVGAFVLGIVYGNLIVEWVAGRD